MKNRASTSVEKLIAVGLAIFFLCSAATLADDNLAITSYFPIPYGEYPENVSADVFFDYDPANATRHDFFFDPVAPAAGGNWTLSDGVTNISKGTSRVNALEANQIILDDESRMEWINITHALGPGGGEPNQCSGAPDGMVVGCFLRSLPAILTDTTRYVHISPGTSNDQCSKFNSPAIPAVETCINVNEGP